MERDIAWIGNLIDTVVLKLEQLRQQVVRRSLLADMESTVFKHLH